MPEGKLNTFKAWIILVALMFTWGSSFILIKKSLLYFTSMQVGALRVGITFLVLLPFAFQRLRKLNKKQWMVFALVSLGNTAPAFLFPKAQEVLDSSISGILNSLTPLFTLIVGLMFFNTKTKWFNVAGVFIGLIGAVGLVNATGNGSFSFNFSYAIYIIIATILYAINVNVIKTYLQGLDSFTVTIFIFFVFGPAVLVFLFGGTPFLNQLTTDPKIFEGLAYVSTLAIIGTAAALIAFNYLIKISTAIFASSVTYLIPIVALLWGVIDGEQFLTSYVIYICLILAGIFLVNAKRIRWVKISSINFYNKKEQ